jgi:hypothetical protein
MMIVQLHELQFTSLLGEIFLINFVACLPMTFSLGLKPLLVNLSKPFLYTLKIHKLSRPDIGVARIALDS